MTYVERGYLPKDRSSGRRPSLPATTESPLFTWSVGQKKKNCLWDGAPSRCLFLKQTRRTKPDNTTRSGAHDGTRPTHRTGKEGQRPGPPTQPGHQETHARKRAHRGAGEPGSFPHVLVRLEGRDTGCTTALSRVPVLISPLRHNADSARESYTGPPSSVYGTS